MWRGTNLFCLYRITESCLCRIKQKWIFGEKMELNLINGTSIESCSHIIKICFFFHSSWTSHHRALILFLLITNVTLCVGRWKWRWKIATHLYGHAKHKLYNNKQIMCFFIYHLFTTSSVSPHTHIGAFYIQTRKKKQKQVNWMRDSD